MEKQQQQQKVSGIRRRLAEGEEEKEEEEEREERVPKQKEMQEDRRASGDVTRLSHGVSELMDETEVDHEAEANATERNALVSRNSISSCSFKLVTTFPQRINVFISK